MENNTKQIKKNVKPIKTKKPRRKMSKLNLWATIIAVIVCIGLIGVTIGLITVANMLRTKPELDVSKFTNSESSVIYDENGESVESAPHPQQKLAVDLGTEIEKYDLLRRAEASEN